MNDVTQATVAAPDGSASGSLWAAIGVLGVVVIALGSALLFVQTRQEELRDANANAAKTTQQTDATEHASVTAGEADKKPGLIQTQQAARATKAAAASGAAAAAR